MYYYFYKFYNKIDDYWDEKYDIIYNDFETGTTSFEEFDDKIIKYIDDEGISTSKPYAEFMEVYIYNNNDLIKKERRPPAKGAAFLFSNFWRCFYFLPESFFSR